MAAAAISGSGWCSTSASRSALARDRHDQIERLGFCELIVFTREPGRGAIDRAARGAAPRALQRLRARRPARFRERRRPPARAMCAALRRLGSAARRARRPGPGRGALPGARGIPPTSWPGTRASVPGRCTRAGSGDAPERRSSSGRCTTPTSSRPSRSAPPRRRTASAPSTARSSSPITSPCTAAAAGPRGGRLTSPRAGSEPSTSEVAGLRSRVAGRRPSNVRGRPTP